MMKIRKIVFCLAAILCAVCLFATHAAAQSAPPAGATWTFAVSGDSRNCGDVVMPGLAADAMKHKPDFYWHLGDLRAIYTFDEDILHLPQFRANPPFISTYLGLSWPDFIENQIKPWGTVPFFVGIGNHELVPPKTREEFIAQFANWLNAPVIQQQRQKDDPRDFRVKNYYHWVQRGVDFIYLDNASSDQFDFAQMRWLDGVLKRASSDPTIKTVVVGMHRALSDSISLDHSMNESPAGEATGRTVYTSLLRLQNESHKRVYVLASHSHFFMDGIFNTAYWREHGGVLPGWIVGTAGAQRYPLSPNWKDARAAETNVYGYLLGTVKADGEIRFTFERLEESGVPAAVKERYTPEFVHWCFTENRRAQ
jgi:hypothetical protein